MIHSQVSCLIGKQQFHDGSFNSFLGMNDQCSMQQIIHAGADVLDTVMGINLLFIKTGTAVFYQNTDAVNSLLRLQTDRTVIAIFADAVFYGIFNQRLDGERWDLKLCYGDILFKYQSVAKPGILDIKIIFDMLQFFFKGNQIRVIHEINIGAQISRKMNDEICGLFRIRIAHFLNRCQCVVQKMWLDLAGKHGSLDTGSFFFQSQQVLGVRQQLFLIELACRKDQKAEDDDAHRKQKQCPAGQTEGVVDIICQHSGQQVQVAQVEQKSVNGEGTKSLPGFDQPADSEDYQKDMSGHDENTGNRDEQSQRKTEGSAQDQTGRSAVTFPGKTAGTGMV